MNIEHLICFQSIVKSHSFSKAADNLYISQSCLSKKIKALENELGGELFIRNCNNAISLSPFGWYVASIINNMVNDYNILLNAIDEYRLNRLKKMNIATFLNVSHSGLLLPIIKFEEMETNFYIETMEKEHSRLKQELALKQIDICFGYYEFLGDVSGYKMIPLFEDPLVLITSKKYADMLNWNNSISLADAKNASFCFPREDMEVFSFLINTCHICGFTPQLTKSDVRLGTIGQYISAGMRCTLNFESIARSKFNSDQLLMFSLENTPKLTMAMYVNTVTKRNIKDMFVSYIQNYYADQA